MTLNIDDDVFALLQAKAHTKGEDPSNYAAAAILEAIARDVWGADSPTGDSSEARTVIERSLADFQDGRFRPFAEYVRDATARYDLPD
jgi:hypothetical protein